MKKILMILGIVLVLALSAGALTVASFAEEAPEVDKFAAMGYDFHEDDDTYPKYKIIYPDGTELVRYQSVHISRDTAGYSILGEADYVEPIPDGSTVVLLSDIYIPNTEEQIGGSGTLFQCSGGRTLNFDFAGYSIICEYKGTMFSSSGMGSVLNVYSSKPGSIISCVTHSKSGSMLLNANSLGALNFGTVGEHSGKNLAAYTAAAAVANNGTVNITDCNVYRMADDHTAYIATRGIDSTINIKGVGVYGVVRDIQIATSNKGNETTGSVINVEDCVIANIGDAGAITGDFLRYIRDDTAIHFKNTAFDHIQFTVDKYYYRQEPLVDEEGKPLPTAVVSIDENCSFYVLPNPDRAHSIVKFPQLATSNAELKVPKWVFVNRVGENIKYPTMIDKAASADNPTIDHDYTLKEHPERVAGIYTFPYKGFEEHSTEISWDFNGVYTTEWWKLGEIPYPYSFRVPKDTEYIQYVVTDPEPVYEFAFYTVAPKVNLTFHYNFTLSSSLYVNVYVPVINSSNASEVVTRVIAGGEVATKENIAEAKTVDIGGEKFYKVAIPIDYSRVSEKMTLSLNVMDVATISAKLSMVDIVNGFLDGDGTPEFKNCIKGFLYTVKERTEATGAQTPGWVMAIIEKRYPENIIKEEDAEK